LLGNPIKMDKMRNITENIKRAISTEALWSVSDFFYFIGCVKGKNLKISFSLGDEEWAQVLFGDILVGYVWKKSPLIFIATDFIKSIKDIIDELNYIVIIETESLDAIIFSLDVDEELINRISFLFNPKCFSATDFWFYNQR
jgi:hypothetical protein